MADKTVTADVIVKDDASKPLEKIGDSAEKNGNRIQRAFAKMSRGTDVAHKGIGKLAGAGAVMFGNLAAQGVTALLSLGKSAITTGIDTAASLEQARIGFTQLLGSASAADKQLSALQNFAATTPFEINGLIDSSRILMGVGVAAEDVIPMLRDFGDTAGALAIPGDAFQRIMLAMSQSIAAGKIKLGDMNQLMNNGLPIWQLLSKAMGKPVGEIQNMISHGQLLTKDVLPKLQAQMQKDYGGSMAKQSQTLNGLWSTLKDTFSLGMADALQGILPLIRDAMPGAIAVLSTILKGLGVGLTFVGGIIRQVADIIRSGWAPQITSSMTGMQKFVVIISGAVAAVRAWILGLYAGEGAVVGMTGWVRNVFYAAQAFKGGVISLWGYLKSLFSTIRSSFGAVWGTFKPLIDKVTSSMDSAGTQGSDLKAVFSAVGAVVKVLAAIIAGALAAAILVMMVAFKSASVVMKQIVIPAIKAIAIVFLDVVGDLIAGAAKAFGWIPGLGGKLRNASREFDKFRARAQAAINGIHGKSVNIWARVKIVGANGRAIRSDLAARVGAGGFATGGVMHPGVGYLVGENGPEYVVPKQGGYVRPVPETRNMLRGNGSDTAGATYVFQFPNAVIGNEQLIAKTVTDAIRRARTQGTRYAV